MKRSRAIYLITAALTELGLTNSPDYDVYDPPTLEQGEKLLNIVEKAIGMLPPPNKAEAVTGRIVYAYYDNEQVEELPDLKYESLVNRNKLWDKENEA